MKKAELMSIINSAVDQALESCESKNPLEAWSRFMDRLDVCVRRRIGEDLERNGRNRYTGEVERGNAQYQKTDQTKRSF